MTKPSYPCSECTGATKVYDSRVIHGTIRRRRKCVECGARFNTKEVLMPNHELKRPRISDADRAEIIAQRNKGVRVITIASITGRSIHTVYAVLREAATLTAPGATHEAD